MSRFTRNQIVSIGRPSQGFSIIFKKNQNLDLHHGRFPIILEGYTNMSWISSVGDHKFTTEWIFTLIGGEFAWNSKKQTCITLLTMEPWCVDLGSTSQRS